MNKLIIDKLETKLIFMTIKSLKFTFASSANLLVKYEIFNAVVFYSISRLVFTKALFDAILNNQQQFYPIFEFIIPRLWFLFW